MAHKAFDAELVFPVRFPADTKAFFQPKTDRNEDKLDIYRFSLYPMFLVFCPLLYRQTFAIHLLCAIVFIIFPIALPPVVDGHFSEKLDQLTFIATIRWHQSRTFEIANSVPTLPSLTPALRGPIKRNKL